jgi:hypothetical protein
MLIVVPRILRDETPTTDVADVREEEFALEAINIKHVHAAGVNRTTVVMIDGGSLTYTVDMPFKDFVKLRNSTGD